MSVLQFSDSLYLSEFLSFSLAISFSTGCNKKNGHPTTEGNVSFPKRLNLTSKFGMFGFLGIVNVQKKFCDSFSKIVDFF